MAPGKGQGDGISAADRRVSSYNGGMQRLLRIAASLAGILLATSCSGGDRAPDFTLRDDHANVWTLSQQRGKAVFLTFGFTHCADTCPATVAKLAQIARVVPPRARNFEVVFLTIDPGRDTSAALHRFVSRFAAAGNAPIIGLTGTPRDIARVKREYHIWSQPTAHDIAHTAEVVLIDPEGRIRAVRDDDESQSSIAHDLLQVFHAS